MKFPDDIDLWLRNGLHQRTEDLDERNAIVSQFEKNGISYDSEIVHFYLEYGPHAFKGWYELLRVEDFEEMIDYAREELEVKDDFLPITSIEGEGITMYQKDSGRVFDVEFGQFEELEDGTLKPLGESFLDFLKWAKRENEK